MNKCNQVTCKLQQEMQITQPNIEGIAIAFGDEDVIDHICLNSMVSCPEQPSVTFSSRPNSTNAVKMKKGSEDAVQCMSQNRCGTLRFNRHQHQHLVIQSGRVFISISKIKLESPSLCKFSLQFISIKQYRTLWGRLFDCNIWGSEIMHLVPSDFYYLQ